MRIVGINARHVALLTTVMFVIHISLALGGIGNLLSGQLSDTDPYMWLLRAEGLATGSQGWWDNSIPRMNAPYGDTAHWTHPFDIVLIALASFAMLFLDGDWHRAVFWGGLLAPPILYAVICFTGAWAVRPLVPGYVLIIVVLLLMLQPVLLLFSQAGRPDHQHLILLSSILAYGFLTRALLTHDFIKWALCAGASIALGLWVSTEFQLTFIMIAAAIGLLWAFRGDPMILKKAAWMIGSTSLFLCIGLLIDRGIGPNLLKPELDRLSFVHIHAVAISCIYLFAFFSLVKTVTFLNSSFFQSFYGRCLLLMAVGTLMVLTITSTGAAKIFLGPSGDILPRMVTDFMQTNSEMMSMWSFFKTSPSRTLFYSAFIFVVIGLCLGHLYRHPQRIHISHILTIVLFVGYAIFSMLHIRFTIYTSCFAVFTFAILYSRFYGLVSSWLQRAFTDFIHKNGSETISAASHALLLGICFFAPLVGFIIPTSKASAEVPLTLNLTDCRPNKIQRELNQLPAGTMLTLPDFSPELLYLTHHNAVAGPYHRNWQGIFDYLDMAKGNIEFTEKIIARRKINYILTCSLLRPNNRYSLNFLSSNQALPPWLEEITLADKADARLYQVNQKLLHQIIANR